MPRAFSTRAAGIFWSLKMSRRKKLSGSGSEESGKDWSDLEEEARKADMEQSDQSDAETKGNKRTKGASAGSKAKKARR